jgi:hypothetical protein
MGEMIDHALDMRPRRQRDGERLVRILFHRALQHFQRAGIAAGIEREHPRHRTQRQILCTEPIRRLAPCAVDFSQPQAGLQRRGNPGRELFRRRDVIAQDAVDAMRPDLAAGFGVDQSDGQMRLRPRSPDRPSEMMARRHRPGHDYDTCAGERGDEIVGDIGRKRQIFGRGLDRPERNRQPISHRDKQRRHRTERVREGFLPPQRLRGCLAVATAVGDREPPEMRKAAAQRHIHDLDAGAALQQFAAGGLKPDLAQHAARRVAEKTDELALQGPGGHAGDGGEFRQAPIVTNIGTHRIQRTPHAARQRRRR